jgi:hypothetical protein
MSHLVRLIAPKWLLEEQPGTKKVLEGVFTDEELLKHNKTGYNIFWRPNHPKEYQGGNVEGKDIDVFNYVFVDMDLKEGKYASKEEFIELILSNEVLMPSIIVDSGGGVHVYWKVDDLEVMAYLRLQRRLARLYDTDLATGMIPQLMRLSGYDNTKFKDNIRPCVELYSDPITYTCEQLDNILSQITAEDETFVKQHYNMTYNVDEALPISGDLPPKFGQLLKKSKEAADLFASASEDRSKSDYRLGHIMLANGFTKEDAINVLYNSAKAMSRAPSHRYNYAANIVSKIWTYEEAEDKSKVTLAPSIRDVLQRPKKEIKDKRFPCHKLLDDTERGFRLGQVIGIVAGSGVGKTTLTLNMFLWFAENNPDYHHFFYSLEQPSEEIIERIQTICGDNTALFDKIHIVSNHNDDDTFKNLSLTDIEAEMFNWQEQNPTLKIGTAVIDHIGVLASNSRNGEGDAIISLCKQMKPVARKLNIMLIMLSQAPREKAGIGDLELDKNAAYGTVFFESFVDYLLLLWQPLKRMYSEGAPTIMALKYGKIRHKRQNKDRILEDVCYQVYFDPTTERLREMTQDEEVSAKFYMNRATNARKADKKTDLVPYVSRRVEANEESTDTSDNRRSKQH